MPLVNIEKIAKGLRKSLPELFWPLVSGRNWEVLRSQIVAGLTHTVARSFAGHNSGLIMRTRLFRAVAQDHAANSRMMKKPCIHEAFVSFLLRNATHTRESSGKTN